ncbi:MAG: beta-L-arabinofuranosidase domain-containing protein [Bacteroides cellulosilyticus]
MLKLTEGLFRMHPKVEYADFYERAMYNHILSTQHSEHGGYVYFTPACPSHYRVYSAPGKAMWCCVVPVWRIMVNTGSLFIPMIRRIMLCM